MSNRSGAIVLVLTSMILAGAYFQYDIPAAVSQLMGESQEWNSRSILFIPDPEWVWQDRLAAMFSAYSLPNILSPFLTFIVTTAPLAALGTLSWLVTLSGVIVATGWQLSDFWLVLLGRFLLGSAAELLGVAQTLLLAKWFPQNSFLFALGINLSVSRASGVLTDIIAPVIATADIPGGTFEGPERLDFLRMGLRRLWWTGAIISGLSSVFAMISALLDYKLSPLSPQLIEESSPQLIEESSPETEALLANYRPPPDHDQISDYQFAVTSDRTRPLPVKKHELSNVVTLSGPSRISTSPTIRFHSERPHPPSPLRGVIPHASAIQSGSTSSPTTACPKPLSRPLRKKWHTSDSQESNPFLSGTLIPAPAEPPSNAQDTSQFEHPGMCHDQLQNPTKIDNFDMVQISKVTTLPAVFWILCCLILCYGSTVPLRHVATQWMTSKNILLYPPEHTSGRNPTLDRIAGLLLALPEIVSTLCMPLVRWILPRIGNSIIVMTVCGMLLASIHAAFAVLSSLWSTNAIHDGLCWILVLGFVAIGLVYAVYTCLIWSAISFYVSPDLRPTAFASATTILHCGLAIGPFVVSKAIQLDQSYYTVQIWAAGICLLGAFVFSPILFAIDLVYYNSAFNSGAFAGDEELMCELLISSSANLYRGGIGDESSSGSEVSSTESSPTRATFFDISAAEYEHPGTRSRESREGSPVVPAFQRRRVRNRPSIVSVVSVWSLGGGADAVSAKATERNNVQGSEDNQLKATSSDDED